jgi:transposase
MHVSSKCQYSSCPAHGRGGDRPSRRHFYPGSTMTDGQWALLAPLLPAAGSTGGRGDGPEKWDRRLVLDAIFYLVRGGIAWRALPADFPPHQTVYALFRRWTRARVVPDLRSVVERSFAWLTNSAASYATTRPSQPPTKP